MGTWIMIIITYILIPALMTGAGWMIWKPPENNQCNVWLPHQHVFYQSEYLAVRSGICRKTLGSLGHSHDACFDPSSDVLRRCR